YRLPFQRAVQPGGARMIIPSASGSVNEKRDDEPGVGAELVVDVPRYRDVSGATPVLVQRGRVVRARHQDEPAAGRILIDRRVGSSVAVEVAFDRSIPRAAPADCERGRVAGRRLQRVPETSRDVVDAEIRLAVAVVVGNDGDVARAAGVFRD